MWSSAEINIDLIAIKHWYIYDNIQYQIYKKSSYEIPYYNNEKILSFGLTDFIDEKIIHVDWFLGRRCNFDCVYCPPTIHDSTSSYPDFKKLQKDYKTIFLE